ncbi:hypothetical protein ACU6QK_10760 [Pseudomonas rhodesiae]
MSHRIAKRALDTGQKSSTGWQVKFLLQGVIRLDEKPMTFCAQRLLKPVAAFVEVRSLISQKVLKLLLVTLKLMVVVHNGYLISAD